jgi:putative glycerol-1-phosphate prenyltransferase
MDILQEINRRKKEGIRSFAVLVDPDKINDKQDLIKLVNLCNESIVDFFFVGGSLITRDILSDVVAVIKKYCNIPVILFPGSHLQIDYQADGILFLSLISGRNAEFLIGQHVVAAPILKNSDLEIIPCGYMLIGSGNETAVSYMSNSIPIPYSQNTVASSTAIAGEMLGLKLIYMDAGSGASMPVSPEMIKEVTIKTELPLIVGGGIDNLAKVSDTVKAGADLLVVGNGIEKNPDFISEVSEYIRNWNGSLKIH